MRRMPLNVEDIEKFVFISYNFVFSGDEKLEIPLVGDYQNNIYYKMFLKYQLGSIQNVPALIFDESTGVYIGLLNDPTDNTFYLVNGHTSQVVDIQMYIENNILNVNITHTTEELLSEDYIKTIFGQDIAGTGDITLYRHELIISTGRTSYDETEYKAYVTYYSSNNLEANTTEKLTTLTKATSSTILRGIVLEFANAGVINATVSGKYSGVNYLGDQSGWALEKAIGGSDGTAITSVSDIVTPI